MVLPVSRMGRARLRVMSETHTQQAGESAFEPRQPESRDKVVKSTDTEMSWILASSSVKCG